MSTASHRAITASVPPGATAPVPISPVTLWGRLPPRQQQHLIATLSRLVEQCLAQENERGNDEPDHG